MNEMIEFYIDEYPGDQRWNRFLSVYNDENLHFESPIDEIKLILSKTVGDPELWMKSEIPALGNTSANEILKLGANGIIALRHAILRMPC